VTPETTDISPAPPLAPAPVAPAARPVASAPPPAYAPAPSVAPLGGYAAPPPAPAHLPAQAPSSLGAHGQPDRWSGSPDEEIAIDPRSAREGRRLRSSGQGGAQGGFLSRRINQVTLGFAALVVLMLGWKALRDPGNGQGDAPEVAAASAPREEPGPAASAAPTAGAGVDPSAAGVGTVPLTPAQVETLGAHMATGMAAFKERRHVEARRAFQQALEVDASNADARRMAYLVSEALLLDAMRDVLVSRNASDAQRRAAKDGALAAVEAFGGGDADPAREALAKAEALNPGDPDLAAATGRLEQKVSASAVAAGARREEKRRASLAELLAAGQRDFDRGDYAKAIGTWNRLLEQDSTRSTQEYYQAEEQIRLAKDRAKAETKRAYADGITAFRAGEYMTARARLEEVVAVDPFNETASQKLRECQTRLREQASAVFKEARVLEEEVRQPDKAIAAYQRVITLVRDPGDSLQQKAQTRLDALLR
jgi:tetratricopeptide (TPR) repeat protein